MPPPDAAVVSKIHMRVPPVLSVHPRTSHTPAHIPTRTHSTTNHQPQFASPPVPRPPFTPTAYVEELRRREKELGIEPDAEVDALLKAEAVQGKRSSIVTDLMLRVLGLEVSKWLGPHLPST